MKDCVDSCCERVFIFIDGAHGYEDVKFDIAEARRLVKDGGFICGDDLELQMHEIDPAFAQAHKEEDYLEDPNGIRDTGRLGNRGGRVSIEGVVRPPGRVQGAPGSDVSDVRTKNGQSRRASGRGRAWTTARRLVERVSAT